MHLLLRRSRAGRLGQGEARRRKAAIEADPRVVDPNQATDRRAEARSCTVQPCDRQQASGLRCCRSPRRGRCAERLRSRSRDDSSEEDRKVLFAGRGDKGGLTTRQYACLVQEWVASIGLDPAKCGTHSLRRTKAVLIYRRTGNLRAVPAFARSFKIESTVRYLGIEVDDAIEIAEKIDIRGAVAERGGSA